MKKKRRLSFAIKGRLSSNSKKEKNMKTNTFEFSPLLSLSLMHEGEIKFIATK